MMTWNDAAGLAPRHGWHTSLLPSNGELVEVNGLCSRILGDTALEFHIEGLPAIGTRTMQPTVTLGGGDFTHTGPDATLLAVHGALRSERYLPAKPWALDVTSYTASEGTQRGEARFIVRFEAMALVQERAVPYAPSMLRRLEGTPMMNAEFVTPLSAVRTA